jgi:hypothetical protein
VRYRSADGIYRDNPDGAMLYVCERYPKCDAYVRTHAGTKVPMGTLADGNLRALRIEAHRSFDQLHTSGIMSRDDAYRWLSAILQSPQSQAHIGNLGEYYCRQVIEESQKILQNRKGGQIYVFAIDGCGTGAG